MDDITENNDGNTTAPATTCGRPVLNNLELVQRAMRRIMVPLQDYVIAEMKYSFGLNWWVEAVMPKRLEYQIPDYAPSSGDVPDEVARTYMDVLLCLKLISSNKLLPPGLHREAREPLSVVRDLRNNLSHYGKDDYTMAQAQDAIRYMAIVSDILELGCGEELDNLIMATMAPMEPQAPVTPPAASAPAKSPASPAPGPAAVQAAPKEPTVTIPAAAPPGETVGVVEACVMACEGMHAKLEEKQREQGNRDTSRSMSNVTKVTRREDHYILQLERPIVADDSLGVILGDVEYIGAQVSFDRYNSGSRTIHMFPGPELRMAMADGTEGMSLFSDLKWLVSGTKGFFSSFGSKVRYPPVPLAYTPSIILSDMHLSDEQRAAVTMAMSQPLSYVWGVPGSGKTQSVLAASVAECVRRGERVAVIAPTNLALEQVLRGLIKAFQSNPAFGEIIDPARDIVRIGTPTSDFAAEFPYVCETKGVQTQLTAKVQQRDHAARILLERRYESLRPLVEECIEEANRIRDNDVSGKRKLHDRLRPVLDTMAGDDRFALNAARVSQGNVCQQVPRIMDLLYGRDRSLYLEGDAAEMSDERLRRWLDDLDRTIARLRPQSKSADRDGCRVVAMTLSKFIISYGPFADGRRRRLEVDHVFVDEAGYCNALQTLTLFTLGAPVTMLGDHMQLPPVCELNRDDLTDWIFQEGEDRFDFLWDLSALYVDRLFDGSLNVLAGMYAESAEPDFVRTAHTELRTTFRFGPNLAEALGRNVYPAGMLSSSPEPLEVRIVNATIDAFPIRNGDYRRENLAEAEAVSAIVDSEGLTDENYVILTPYNDQIWCLRRHDRTLSDHVLTVHRSQGREWDTVIVSVCDGHHNPQEKVPRFTSSRVIEGARIGLKVINTALSRAKRRLIIVCDADWWAAQEDELLGDVVRGNRR